MAFNVDYDPLTGIPFTQGAPREVPPQTRVAPAQAAQTPADAERLRAIGLDPNFSNSPVFGPQPPAPPRPSAPRQPSSESSETGQALRDFQAALRSQHTAVPQPQTQLSVLDMLRKRMANEMENEQAQRASDLGNALLTSRNRSLLGALGEGFRAQDEGSRARMDRLRQLAEAERQERSLENQIAQQQAQAAYQTRSLDIREREVAQQNRPQYQVVGTDQRGNAIVIDMRNPTQRMVLEGITPTQVTALNARTDAAREAAAIRAGTAAVAAAQRDALGREIDRGTLDRIFREAYDRAMNSPQPGGAPQTGGGAPSETLRYDGPRIAPRQ